MRGPFDSFVYFFYQCTIRSFCGLFGVGDFLLGCLDGTRADEMESTADTLSCRSIELYIFFSVCGQAGAIWQVEDEFSSRAAKQ